MKKKKKLKEVKMHKLLVCACKSQNFAQSQKKFAQLHNRETVAFINSESLILLSLLSLFIYVSFQVIIIIDFSSDVIFF